MNAEKAHKSNQSSEVSLQFCALRVALFSASSLFISRASFGSRVSLRCVAPCSARVCCALIATHFASWFGDWPAIARLANQSVTSRKARQLKLFCERANAKFLHSDKRSQIRASFCRALLRAASLEGEFAKFAVLSSRAQSCKERTSNAASIRATKVRHLQANSETRKLKSRDFCLLAFAHSLRRLSWQRNSNCAKSKQRVWRLSRNSHLRQTEANSTLDKIC